MLKELYAAGYSEDTIVTTLATTHIKFRRVVGQQLPLTNGALQEIRTVNSELTVKQVCKHYKCSAAEAHKALYRDAIVKANPTDDAILLYYNEASDTCDAETIAAHFDCSKTYVTQRLEHLELLHSPHNATAAERELCEQLLRSNCYSTTAIASRLGRSQAWVSQVAAKAGLSTIKKPRQNHNPDWPTILAETREDSISSVARKHKVGRSTIYKRLKDES